MNVETDCKKCGIAYSCNDCKENCKQRLPCNRFSPTEAFYNKAIEFLKETTPLSNSHILRRYVKKNICGITCDNDTIDSYYVELINDTLLQIRKFEPAYVFTLEQVKEILMFEPDITVSRYDDYCYKIKLNSRRR